MEQSVFINKAVIPGNSDIKTVLFESFEFWNEIKGFVTEKIPMAKEEWSYPGKKYGWSFRLKDKKRTIIYLLPRDGYFKVAFVFGQKATDAIMNSDISNQIKNELAAARLYAEGRGIRIDVKNNSSLCDIKKLIIIKLDN